MHDLCRNIESFSDITYSIIEQLKQQTQFIALNLSYSLHPNLTINRQILPKQSSLFPKTYQFYRTHQIALQQFYPASFLSEVWQAILLYISQVKRLKNQEHKMQEQIDQNLVYECGGMIMEVLSSMPVHNYEVIVACDAHPKYHQSREHPPAILERLKENFTEMNKQAIRDKFIFMVQNILTAIEYQMQKEPEKKFKDIHEYSPIIIELLDRDIYIEWIDSANKKFQPKQPGMTPMGPDQKQKNVDLFFGSLLSVMHELLAIMVEYWGYKDEQDSMQIALCTALIDFMQKNSQSTIAREDQQISLALADKKQQMMEIQEQKPKSQEYSYMNLLGRKLQAILPSKNTVYGAITDPFSYFSSSSARNSKQIQIILEAAKMKEEAKYESKISPEEMEIINYYNKMTIKQILQQMSNADRQQFIQFFSDFMTSEEHQIFLEETKASEEVSLLISEAYSTKSQGKNMDKKQIVWIMLIYKAFEKKYCSGRRAYIISLCKKPEICQKLKSSVEILKVIESSFLNQSLILKLIRQLPVENSKAGLAKLNQKKIDQLTLELEHEMNRIHLKVFQKKFEKEPRIQFHKLSECPPRKNITLLFSGFLSENTNKLDEWSEMVKSGFDSEIYSVRWESKSVEDFLTFILDGAKDIASANFSIAGMVSNAMGPYLRAAAIARQLYIKFHQNPFNPAYQCARVTGNFIAELLISSFQGHFINLVGFSLGTELMYHILQRLHQRNEMHLINRVYFMGGVASKLKLEKLLQQQNHILRIVNMHSDNDYILKYLLRVCKSEMQPIGNHPINEKIKKHKIKNVDGTALVGGHTDYRDNLKLIEMLMEIHD